MVSGQRPRVYQTLLGQPLYGWRACRRQLNMPNLPHLCFFVLKPNQIMCMRPFRHCAQALHEFVNIGCPSVTFQDLPGVLGLVVIPQQQMHGGSPILEPARLIFPAPSLSMTLYVGSVLASMQWKSQTVQQMREQLFLPLTGNQSLEPKQGASVS